MISVSMQSNGMVANTSFLNIVFHYLNLNLNLTLGVLRDEAINSK